MLSLNLLFSQYDSRLSVPLISVRQLKVWIFPPYIPRLKPNHLRLCGSTQHKSQRNAKHPALSNICLSFLLIAGGGSGVIPGCLTVKGGRRILTGRVGPMDVWTGVGGRAVVPQGGVAFTAVGWREGDGTPKLAVRTGRRAERTWAWNKPATYWLHRWEETWWNHTSTIRLPKCDMKSEKIILTLRVSRLLVFNGIFSYVSEISSEKKN